MPRVLSIARRSATNSAFESNQDNSTLAEKDSYCWLCHRTQTNKFCSGCIRTYHLKCLKVSSIGDPWQCPECKEIEKSDAATVEPFDMEPVKLMVERACQLNDFESFVAPVCRNNFPDFYDCMVNPMSLDQIKQKVGDGKYKSLRGLLGDVKWISHNISAFFSGDKKYATQGKHLVKLFCDEIESIEKCPECFVNANLHGNWFSMVCSKPHLVLWAKFAGFPLWPCKLMCVDGNTAYVRFFGDHKHAKIDIMNCFLYSRVTTRTTKKSLIDALHEADSYIQNLSSALGGVFVYADVKTPFDPSKLDEYLDNMVIEAMELEENPEASVSSSPEQIASRSSSPEKTAARSSSPEKTAARSFSPEKIALRSSSPEKMALRSSSPEKMASRSSSPEQIASPISSSSRKHNSSETDDQSSSAELITGENVSSSSDVNKIGERRKSVQFALERNEYIKIERIEQHQEPEHSSAFKRVRLSNGIEKQASVNANQMQPALVVPNAVQYPLPKVMEAVVLNQISDRSCDTAAVISELYPILHEIATATNCNGMNRAQSIIYADQFNDEMNRIRANINLRNMKAKEANIQRIHASEMENLRVFYENKMAAMTSEHRLKLAEMKGKQWCQGCGKESPSTYCCDRNCHDIFENQLLAEPMNEMI